jgi:hypothetical protein
VPAEPVVLKDPAAITRCAKLCFAADQVATFVAALFAALTTPDC